MWQFRRWPCFFKSGGPGSGLYSSPRRRRELEAAASRRTACPRASSAGSASAISRSNPEVVYALVEAKKSALLRSDDGGRSWKTVNVGAQRQPAAVLLRRASGSTRQDPNRVYSVDYDGPRLERRRQELRDRWSAGDEIHGDHHALWIDPANPRHIDRRQRRRRRGEPRPAARPAASSPTCRWPSSTTWPYDMDRPYNVYGGLQDNGSWRGPVVGLAERRHPQPPLEGGRRRRRLRDAARSRATRCRATRCGRAATCRAGTCAPASARTIKPAPRAGRASSCASTGTPALAHRSVRARRRSISAASSCTARPTAARPGRSISPDLTTNNPEWQKADESGGLTRDVTGAENYTTIVTIAPSPDGARPDLGRHRRRPRCT